MAASPPARIPVEIAGRLVDPAVYAGDQLHDTYRWLRANHPLAVAQPVGFDPFWVVTRHADLLEISRRNDDFHSGDLPTTLTARDTLARIKQITGGSPHLMRTLLHMDAPDHKKYRALTQAWFMPSNLKRLETALRDMARRAVDRMAAQGGECDFVNDVSRLYPLHVIMSILGVPESDEPLMLKLTQQLFGSRDTDIAREGQSFDLQQLADELGRVVRDIMGYFAAISAQRRAEPRDDLATVIATSSIDGAPISEYEATSYYLIIATAGHDTTSSSTATAMWALAKDPALFAQVKADPALIPGLIDEAIRWATPVKTFMRSATRDVEVGGQRIAKGDWLMLCYASGNRDEAVFEDPFAFRADRNPNRHLAFGYGAHLCLGQHLAKLEMRILYEELLPRLRSVQLAGEAPLVKSVFVNGPKTLPIAFDMA